MKFLYSIFLLLIFISSCADYKSIKTKASVDKKLYSSKGFILVYNDSLKKSGLIKKKINNNEDQMIHSFLKAKTPVRITNLENMKSYETVVTKKSTYPKIFNGLISKKIANEIELDLNNPYVEILEIKKNEKFIAKEGNTYEEERNVAEKVPVQKIQINTIGGDEISIEKKSKKEDKKNFFILVSDFYYESSAYDLKTELEKTVKSSNFFVKKINKNKYRLSIGPFKDFNSLKSVYISLNTIGFEGLDIYKK
tara:strand:+ start:4312 stop:5067 length:756 start_codon:yes stop_codon:yes gene_type:complete